MLYVDACSTAGEQDRFGRLMQIATGHRDREQLSTLGAANLDGPAPPLAVQLDTQIESDELRQLKCSFGSGKFAYPNVTLRVLRARKSKRILGHGWVPELVARENHRYQGRFDVRLPQ